MKLSSISTLYDRVDFKPLSDQVLRTLKKPVDDQIIQVESHVSFLFFSNSSLTIVQLLRRSLEYDKL